MSYKPSKYQEAIYDFVRVGRGNGFVDAVAGSGKTYTLVQCAELISGDGVFCAFNKHIADELKNKLASTTMEARTIHSIGMRTVTREHGRVRVENNKYYRIARDVLDSAARDKQLSDGTPLSRQQVSILKDEYPVGDMNTMCRLMRINLLDAKNPEDVDAIASHHGLHFHSEIFPMLQVFMREMLRRGFESASTEIDFADMLWYPCTAKLTPDQYPWVFVDEAQDLNRAQLELVRRSVAPGGRVLFVGDPHQAIYGFAGADANSVAVIIREMECKLLPLSVCYRCPTQVIEMAQKYVPQIEAAPGKGAGEIKHIGEDMLVAEAREGDLVVCRINAPLLQKCYELISSGISAAVKGRDIGKGLVKVVRDIQKRHPSQFTDFTETLNLYVSVEVAKLQARSGDTDSQIESLYDRRDCIAVVYNMSGAEDYAALVGAIESLFATDRPSVMLSSVHRAKGLENERVFLLRPEIMPLPMRKAWQRQQEENLIYVAYTRAQEEFIFVHENGAPSSSNK